MPALVASKSDARDLVALMATWTDTARVPHVAVAATDSAAHEGEVLFAQYQCRGCHELGGEGRKIGPALDDVGARRPPDYLRALLLDPQRVVPGTSMKNFDLWDEEAVALTAYLGSLRSPAASEAYSIPTGVVADGPALGDSLPASPTTLPIAR
jgi:cytochrome c2